MRTLILLAILAISTTAHARNMDECTYFLTRNLSSIQKEKISELRSQLLKFRKKKDTYKKRVKLVSKILEIRGVDHNILNNGFELVISRSDRTPLNRLSRKIYERVGKTKLKYNPRETEDTGGVFFSPVATIYLDEKFMAIPQLVSSARHEFGHAIIHFDEANGKVRLFYGDASSIEANVKLTDSKMYKDYLSFDEVFTYAISMRQSLNPAVRRYKTLQLKYLDGIKRTVKNGIHTVEGIQDLSEKILNILKNNPEKIKFKIDKVTQNYSTSFNAVVVEIEDRGVQYSFPYSDKETIALVRRGKKQARDQIVERLKKQMSLFSQLADASLPFYSAYFEIVLKAHNIRRSFTTAELDKMLEYANELQALVRDADEKYIKYVENSFKD